MQPYGCLKRRRGKRRFIIHIMAYTEQEAGMMAHEAKGAARAAGGWGVLGTLLGATGAATGITALATKVPKNGGCGCDSGCGGWERRGWGGPSAFMAYSKGCENEVALTAAIYQGRITSLNEARDAREIDTNEKFQLWKSQVDADFGLYKTSRDGFDVLAQRIGALESRIAVGEAVRPYQDRLLQCEIDKAFTASINHTDRRTCRMIEGVVVLPDAPTVTGYSSHPFGCPTAVAGSATA